MSEAAVKNLLTLTQDIKDVVDRMDKAEHRVQFLERIIRQAAMTHGGILKIDPKFAEEAIATSSLELWIASPGVQLMKVNPYNLHEGIMQNQENNPHWGGSNVS